HETIEVALDLVDADVPGLPSLHTEALVEERPVHALDEAVRPGAADLGLAMLDALHREQQLVRMLLGQAAVLAAIVSEDRADRHAERLVEGQHTIVEQIGR